MLREKVTQKCKTHVTFSMACYLKVLGLGFERKESREKEKRGRKSEESDTIF